MQRVRCFIAVEFNEQTKAALQKLQRDVLKLHELKSIRLVSSDALHITLNFLGEITSSDVKDIGAALRSVTFHPFCVTLAGIRALPNPKKMRVIYVGFNQAEGLIKLNSQIETALPQRYRPDREFHPHVTLARVKKRVPDEFELLTRTLQTVATYRVGRCSINSFQLKKSTLTPRGPIYETLEEFLL